MTKTRRRKMIRSRHTRKQWLASYDPDGLRKPQWRAEDDLETEPLELSVRTMRSATSSSAMAMRRPSQLRL